MSGRCGVENSEQTGPVGPGEMLRQAREAQGISVREMADRLNWLPAYVEDIEDNQFERLRGTVFVRGYLRTYGKCLGVSETALMSALAEMNLEADLPASSFPLEAAPRVWQTPAFSIGVGIIVAAVVALLFWRWQGGEQTATVVPPAVTEVERQANSPVELEPVATPATNSSGGATEMDTAAQAVGIAAAAQPQADTNGEADAVAATPATNSSGDATEMDAAAQAVSIAAVAQPQADTNGQADTVAAASATNSADATEMDAAAQAVGIAAAAPPQTDTNGQADTVAVVLDRDSTGPPIELAAANAELTFRFDGDCWLEVRNADDELIYADLRREGDQLQLDGAAPFHILVGDARMVELYFRGEPFAIRPRPGRVMARFTVGE